jgi:hypothetical protein
MSLERLPPNNTAQPVPGGLVFLVASNWMSEGAILSIMFAVVAPLLGAGLFYLMWCSRIGDRIWNIFCGVSIIVGLILPFKGPGFLGFYRPADLLHILFNIGILCGYLLSAHSIYRALVPKQKQTNPELAGAHK